MVSSTQQNITTVFQTTKPTNPLLAIGALVGMLGLSACQTVPSTPAGMPTSSNQSIPTSQTQTMSRQPSDTTVTTVTQAPIIREYEITEEAENDYPIEPYIPPATSDSSNPLTQDTPVLKAPSSLPTQHDTVIVTPSRNDYMINEPSVPSHNELLERARKNSQQRTQQTATNNSDLPAFRNLMQTGISQLKAGKLTNAENSFTRAQRLAPKSSAVYFYLAQVALKKNQPRKAEAMARRGLSVSQDANRRRALWQVILQSGQAQGNARVVSEAKQALR